MVAAPLAKARLSAQTAEAGGDERRVQQVVDALRARLGLTAAVTVKLVDRDVRMASVRADVATAGGFVLTLQRDFITRLSAEQLQAALAHELGHVWISTHHPYLQTEQLANRIAMRVVPREHLIEVYAAVWGADALHGSFEKFLGVESTVASATQQQ
ncbi:MAG TPA: M48 family metalloprotease [Luteitalea sp.]|nr:M48 family metalloprotease [Luteitalea sp.]